MTNLSQLVPISDKKIGDSLEKSVFARELHRFLESKQDFSHWIKNRIKKYGFLKDLDFSITLSKTKNPNGGRPSNEYFITLDMAKHLALVESTKKGHEVRKYFIQAEKALRQVIYTPELPERKNHYTVKAYGRYSGMLLSLEECLLVQKECVRLCKLNRTLYYPFNDNPKATFYTFSENVLQIIFDEIGTIIETRRPFDQKTALQIEKAFFEKNNMAGNGLLQLFSLMEENKKMFLFIMERELYPDYQVYKRV